MRISVFGLGYVGSVSAACFASQGHDVIGVDVNPIKVDLIARGRTPVVEEKIGELIAEVVRAGSLRATTDVAEAIAASDVSLICVGTPSAANGSLSTEYLERVASEIGGELAKRDRRHTVVFRSTMLPGTCQDLLVPVLERSSGLRAGADFGVVVNPEFLREGTSVRDFFDPPKTVIGEYDRASGDIVAGLYDGLPGEVFRVSIPVAEMTKYADNSFHALKIGFANEVGAICQALGLDSHEVMDVFLSDTKLNVSPAYLTPRVRLRRFLPSEGRPRARVRRTASRCVGPHPRAHTFIQRHANPSRRRCGYRHRRAQDRAVRSLVQGRHGRPPGEPAGRTGRAAYRQGVRPSHLRRECDRVAPPRCQPGVHRANAPTPRGVADAARSTK